MPNERQPRGPVPIEAVIKKTLSGIVKAQGDYEAWSGGSWLWEAPEYMLTMYIAKELGTMPGSKYLTLESNVRSTLEDAGGMGRGRTSKFARLDGKFDIVLWWKNCTPRTVIEVKNQIGIHNIEKDIERISTILRKKNTFRCGLIAFYTSKGDERRGGEGAKETIEKQLDNIEQRASDTLKKEEFCLSRHDSEIIVDGDSAWIASVLQIQRAPEKSSSFS